MKNSVTIMNKNNINRQIQLSHTNEWTQCPVNMQYKYCILYYTIANYFSEKVKSDHIDYILVLYSPILPYSHPMRKCEDSGVQDCHIKMLLSC